MFCRDVKGIEFHLSNRTGKINIYSQFASATKPILWLSQKKSNIIWLFLVCLCTLHSQTTNNRHGSKHKTDPGRTCTTIINFLTTIIIIKIGNKQQTSQEKIPTTYMKRLKNYSYHHHHHKRVLDEPILPTIFICLMDLFRKNHSHVWII